MRCPMQMGQSTGRLVEEVQQKGVDVLRGFDGADVSAGHLVRFEGSGQGRDVVVGAFDADCRHLQLQNILRGVFGVEDDDLVNALDVLGGKQVHR